AVARLDSVLEPVEALHEIPQRVRVQHEPRARHDVGPIARLILLQQTKTLMFLREQPAERPLDARPQAASEAWMRAEPVETIDRDEPPQRRVDAADVPEIGFARRGIDELRDLPVRSLMLAERLDAGGCAALEIAVARKRHPERANRRVAREHSRVAALLGLARRRRGEHTGRGQIALQQLDRARAARLEQIRFVGRVLHRAPIVAARERTRRAPPLAGARGPGARARITAGPTESELIPP